MGSWRSAALQFTDAGVIQTPGHKVTKMGQEVTLRCEPISGHRALYWYRQTSGQGPGLLIYFNDQDPLDDSGMPKEWFSAEMTEKTFSTLKIEPTEPKDSATYLCASSVDTALQSQPLPVQKPSSFPFGLQPPAVPSSLSKLLPCQHKDVVWCSPWLWRRQEELLLKFHSRKLLVGRQ
uniref:Ig-like domain-containing protein n=1 Tax=Ursus americanus TaxID=9643 RepID=A0A452R8F5_URSAM